MGLGLKNIDHYRSPLRLDLPFSRQRHHNLRNYTNEPDQTRPVRSRITFCARQQTTPDPVA
jgi:hypothetical protein